MLTKRALGLALAATLSASALAGCSQGGDDKKEAPTAKDAITKSQDTVNKYAGLSMKTKGKVDNKQTAEVSVYGDAKGTTQDLKGKIDGDNVEMIYVGDKQYSKAGKKFYQQSSGEVPSAIVNKIADKWVETPLNSSDKDDLATPSFIKGYTDDSNASVKALLDTKEKVTEDKVGDRDAWKIVSSDKKTTVWVSADDKYDILKSLNLKFKGMGEDDTNDQTVEFFDQGKTHEVKAPEGALKAEDIMKSGM